MRRAAANRKPLPAWAGAAIHMRMIGSSAPRRKSSSRAVETMSTVVSTVVATRPVGNVGYRSSGGAASPRAAWLSAIVPPKSSFVACCSKGAASATRSKPSYTAPRPGTSLAEYRGAVVAENTSKFGVVEITGN